MLTWIDWAVQNGPTPLTLLPFFFYRGVTIAMTAAYTFKPTHVAVFCRKQGISPITAAEQCCDDRSCIIRSSEETCRKQGVSPITTAEQCCDVRSCIIRSSEETYLSSRRRKHWKPRIRWVQPLLLQTEKFGALQTLYEEMRNYDANF
jgi:hypothetical protein